MVEESYREVVVRRLEHARHEAVNVRGGTVRMGTGDTADFTPVELLLAAVAGCSGLDVDFITSKRGEPDVFSLTMTARKVRDDEGNHLTDLTLTYDVRFPAGTAGDAAREALPMAVARSHDRICTVSRTVELGAPVTVQVLGI
jgi:uncharacterized OsmC-like protein